MFAPAASRDATGTWKAAAIALAVLAPFFVYFQTVESIVEIWNKSDTFAHGYIILPISLWLIWRRRQTLPLHAARPWWPGLLLLAGCGCGWLLAELAAVQVVKQYAFVSMIPLICLTVLGPRMAWAMAFPLLFLLLAVPFGEVLIEPLIGVTADFTVAALQMSGIPVLRNGSHFEIPTGSWAVVEACSGVRYLISSFTLGCLYAYLNYHSRLRRTLFILLSIGAPIVANGLRAYMIVMLGHLSGMTLAVGVDHLIYGWVFFGIVMFAMFWIGSFWREEMQATPGAAEATTGPSEAGAAVPMFVAATGAAIAVVAVWPVYARYIEQAAPRVAAVLPETMAATWKERTPFTQWTPRFSKPSAEFTRYFERDGKQVGLSLLYYREARRDSQLISSINRMVGEKDAGMRQVASAGQVETFGGRTLKIREATIEIAGNPIIVWHWYWIDGTHTASDYAGKLLLARERLLMRGGDGASVIVFAPYSQNAAEARGALRSFLSENIGAIEKTLASAGISQPGAAQ
ncbi:exosortase A [Noviherbaspirillum denitrificans]|uniref:Exosortase A n=2 Tax=Noviherbaspirillum denitrificans TaxID=1968433 RepID=A0A254TK93_9BURK|nr:exosortase A [Noviherbaspirillum denitrificans]